jgi:DNA-binding beta-propeller fold protein YncE
MIFKDGTNTATIGNLEGQAANATGQLPGSTSRRDSHGMAITPSGDYIHTVDRIQNNVEVFNTATLAHTTYDLLSADGQGNGLGACAAASVLDDPALPGNDPAPDLMEATPDGKYLVVALRGPVPVSVTHSAQGSCPGVGIIELLEDGATGRLVGVLSTTNTVDTAPLSAPGGHAYTGAERSDIHGAAIRRK